MMVMLDPGHGGEDPGAIGHDPRGGSGYVEGINNVNVLHPAIGITEASLNWDLVEQVMGELMALGHAVSRTLMWPDQDLPLAARARAAAGSHCMVSIHHNAAESPWARGFEVFVHKPEGGEVRERDLALASLIVEECRPALEAWGVPLRNPPIKADADWASRGRLTLLAGCEPPVCLLEICFMSNPLELIAAQMPPFRWQMAVAIARGITRFSKEVLHESG